MIQLKKLLTERTFWEKYYFIKMIIKRFGLNQAQQFQSIFITKHIICTFYFSLTRVYNTIISAYNNFVITILNI